MATPLDEVCLASLPAAALPALAPLRCHPDVEAWRSGERLWVLWPAGSSDVLHRLLPVAGLELYTRREGLWYRLGRRLPAFEVVLTKETMPLHRLLTPAPCQPEAPPANHASGGVYPRRDQPGGSHAATVALRLVREEKPRLTTALRCELVQIGKWSERATSAELAAVRGAYSGNRVLLLGGRLPPLPGERFWGERVLLPLGQRAEPDLPESALREVLGLAEGEIAVLDQEGVDIVPAGALRPLTRAGVRLALGGERAWTP
jgi:hypothetical protein